MSRPTPTKTTRPMAGSMPFQHGLFEYPTPEGSDPALLGNQCRRCCTTFFPKRHLCPCCFDQGRLEEVRLDRHGTIYAATLVHVSSPTGIQAPYIYGYVDLPENRIRIPTLFCGHEIEHFTPGRDVELAIEPIRTSRDGIPIIGYKFRLAPIS